MPPDQIQRLFDAVAERRGHEPASSRTAKLLAGGRPKICKKLGEEAVEVVVDGLRGDREAVILESADLLYQLVVLWVHMGVPPEEVWAEMDRRESRYGLAEKIAKSD
ncbi:phosphoribosyl-ATP diphosphatase [Geminicoccaceae bacterium 1502E]|uniref:Phosphoribosyl-ATP pyrophosphatase n=1 Tax=Marinimicrococcus flavescens TaxID=3031815 RepID=A0AAP3UZH6_9PROT|nr:phosphoribosyl-ATP diphosphatase [Marinimicrococcus flavescens]MDX6748889.1 phosphoribosyl-ATP diphosphatase [Geminicoccaceae bacterium 1502E]